MQKSFITYISCLLLLCCLLTSNRSEAGRCNDQDSDFPSKLIWGLDLSHHQDEINWTLLAQNKPHFIFFKATEGTSIVDETYRTYRKKAQQLSIPTGAYHFFSFMSPGETQAANFLNTAQLQRGDLPPVLDIEWVKRMPQGFLVTREAEAWLKMVERRLGVKPIIYCNYLFYKQYLQGKLKQDYPLWLTDYKRKPDFDCLFWQKTNNYTIKGIKGKVDYNLFQGDAKQLKKILLK